MFKEKEEYLIDFFIHNFLYLLFYFIKKLNIHHKCKSFLVDSI